MNKYRAVIMNKEDGTVEFYDCSADSVGQAEVLAQQYCDETHCLLEIEEKGKWI